MTILNNILRHKSEAEKLFCAAVFRGGNADDARRSCGWVDPAKFSDEKLRRFWELILAGADTTKAAIDTALLVELATYRLDVIHSWDINHYAATIAEDMYLTDITQKATAVLAAVTERKLETVRDISLEMGATAAMGAVNLPDATDAGLEFIGSLSDEPSTMLSGITKFDSYFGGFSRQALTLIAARPQMGKTALALQIARVNATAGKKVIYFSIEMSKSALWRRMALGDTEINSRKYKTGTLTEDEKQRLIESTNYILTQLGDRLLIDDRSNLTSAEIFRAVAAIKPDLIIVDHLSLVADQGDNEVLRLGQISWKGKALAKEFGCAAIYLQQLNRGLEARENKRPMLSDLRGSGELEQNADVVVFIHRPDYYQDKPIEVSGVELVIAKDRDGARNECVKCQYHLTKQKFYGEAK